MENHKNILKSMNQDTDLRTLYRVTGQEPIIWEVDGFFPIKAHIQFNLKIPTRFFFNLGKLILKFSLKTINKNAGTCLTVVENYFFIDVWEKKPQRKDEYIWLHFNIKYSFQQRHCQPLKRKSQLVGKCSLLAYKKG